MKKFMVCVLYALLFLSFAACKSENVPLESGYYRINKDGAYIHLDFETKTFWTGQSPTFSYEITGTFTQNADTLYLTAFDNVYEFEIINEKLLISNENCDDGLFSWRQNTPFYFSKDQ